MRDKEIERLVIEITKLKVFNLISQIYYSQKSLTHLKYKKASILLSLRLSNEIFGN